MQAMKSLSSGAFVKSNGVFLIQRCKYFQFKSKTKPYGTDALSKIRTLIEHNFTISPKHGSRVRSTATVLRGEDIRSKEQGQ